MKQPKTFLLLSVIVAVLILGVAYAAISSINLEITGTATVDPSQANFDVRFLTTTNTHKGNADIGGGNHITVSANVTGNTTAEMVVSGMNRKGDLAQATFTVKNYSTDLYSKLTVATTLTGDSTGLLSIRCLEGQNVVLAPGEQTDVTVEIMLNKTLITEEPFANVKVTITAAPQYHS